MFRILFSIFLFWTSILAAGPVKLGVDVLKDEAFAVLKGKKIGLVVHPASVNSQLTSTIEILQKTDRCKLVALFGPEHGIYGNEYSGITITDQTDLQTGLPTYSLYGNTRKPTSAMLQGLDALVFDLQDIGSRSYTYISTMKLCLEACAEAGIDFVVLDRPNPLGGERIEGPMVEKDFESFISKLHVPYLHGMTMGELAHMVKESIAPHYQKLHVVKMSGWKRSMVWEDTRLEWVPTSPHIPQASTCAAYAATGILGELGQLSNGVGYTQPFELIGAPWIKADLLAEALGNFWLSAKAYYQASSNHQPINMKSSYPPKGIRFRSAHFKPFYDSFKDEHCGGVQIYLDSKKAGTLVEINFRLLEALDAPKLFRQASADQISMFDKACGTDEARQWLIDGRDLHDLFEKWKTSCSKFREIRRKFLLYD